MGRELAEPEMALRSPEAELDFELPLWGKVKNVLHALVLRHLLSSFASLIFRRYVSSPLRRSSVSCGLETVFENQDFCGSKAGGGLPPAWVVMEE